MSSIKPLKQLTSVSEASEIVKEVIASVDSARREVAQAYAFAPSHTETEHALGECLTYLRKAIEKARKAYEELAQPELPFGDN